jgi:hypothetical protein
LWIANPNKIEQIFFGNVAPLGEKSGRSRNENKRNDEARMTKDEGMKTPKVRNGRSKSFRH